MIAAKNLFSYKANLLEKCSGTRLKTQRTGISLHRVTYVGHIFIKMVWIYLIICFKCIFGSSMTVYRDVYRDLVKL